MAGLLKALRPHVGPEHSEKDELQPHPVHSCLDMVASWPSSKYEPDRVLGEGMMGFARKQARGLGHNIDPGAQTRPRPGHRWVTHQQPAQQSWAVFALRRSLFGLGSWGVEVAG